MKEVSLCLGDSSLIVAIANAYHHVHTGYYHELFLRGRPKLCLHMRRVGIPTLLPTGEVVSRRDQRRGRKSFLGMDPDFYTMKEITIHDKKKAEEEEKEEGDETNEVKQEEEGKKKASEDEQTEGEASDTKSDSSGKSDTPSGGATELTLEI